MHTSSFRRLAPAASALAATFLIAACSRQEAPPEPIRAVKLQTVGAAPLVAKAEFAGDIRARTEAQLGFRVAGKVLTRNVELGQSVKAGQLLAQLDGADYALAAQGAQAQVQAAVTQRDLASANFFERNAGLVRGGYREAPITNIGFKRLRGRLQTLIEKPSRLAERSF